LHGKGKEHEDSSGMPVSHIVSREETVCLL